MCDCKSALRWAVAILATAFVLASCDVSNLFPKTVIIDPTEAWTATGIDVEEGDELEIAADGTVSLHPDYPQIGPDGDSSLGTPVEYDLAHGTDYADGHPMPNALIGALVGKVGESGQVFLVGSDATIVAPRNGELLLAVNDNIPDNNAGTMDVRIKVRGGLFR